MGEWERGLEAATQQGIISGELRDRLTSLEFDREPAREGFPMRIALFVLGGILLLSAAFAVVVRVLGDDPSELLIALVFAIVGAVAEGIAWLLRKVRPLSFLAGIFGAFAGIPFAFAVALALPGDGNSAGGALGSLVAAAWALSWYRRVGGGIPIAAVLGGITAFIGFVTQWADLPIETTGALLCAVGALAAVVSIFGKLKPSLPPLVASLIIIGWGCVMLNSYGGRTIAVAGIAISGALFLVAYRRADAMLSAATALSTGVWAVVLTGSLTSGRIAPLIVAALIGVALIFWGTRLSRR